MSEAEREAYAKMSPEERTKMLRSKGVAGPALSAEKVAALPAEQRAMYEQMSDVEKAAFAGMTPEEQAVYGTRALMCRPSALTHSRAPSGVGCHAASSPNCHPSLHRRTPR